MRPSAAAAAAVVAVILAAAASLVIVAAMAADVGSSGAGRDSSSSSSSAAAGCNPALLTPCAGPALYGGAVPARCCAQLRAQEACLCGYARSPNYGGYVRSPNARRLFAACRLPMPTCPAA